MGYFFLPALILIFSVLTKRLAVKNVSDIACLVLSGTLNLNSQLMDQAADGRRRA